MRHTPATAMCARALELELRRAVPSAERFSRASTRSGAARRPGPFLRTPLFPRVGIRPPVLPFTSAICVSGIPGLERAVCRVSLFHRHDHTPHFDVAISCPSCAAGRSSYLWPMGKDKDADRREAGFFLGAQVPALTVRPTTRTSDHHFRGSRHGVTNRHRAM